MPAPDAHAGPPRYATWVNLIVPGGGLIALGRIRTGVVIGLAFAASANAAVTTRLIAPDEVPIWVQNLAIITACVLYIAAQGLLLGAGRRSGPAGVPADVRRRALGEVERLVGAGEYESARRVIDDNRALLDEDLHVAYRRAQVLTELRADGAFAAWQHLGTLDRHGIYRAERLDGLERVRCAASPVVDEST